MLVKLNILGGNHQVLFQTHITYADEDHTISKFLHNVHFNDGSKINWLLKC